MESDVDAKAVKTRADLLKVSYDEILDAVKHQDDKIGRLFTGIAFLTAAALALANLGSARYLDQRYVSWSAAPPAILSLAAFLLLVLMSVTILISSLGTPLRIPGLQAGRGSKSRGTGTLIDKTSQIYFGEISRIGIDEWEEKWKKEPAVLEQQLEKSLIKETHNLAVRTQFKYGRMNEAIALFNLALLFLAITMIFCVTSASSPQTQVSQGAIVPPASLPQAGRWSLAGSVAIFLFLQLLNQVRYSRQTVDEMFGTRNRLSAVFKYLWALLASTWALLLGAAVVDKGWWCGVGLAGIAFLAGGVATQERPEPPKDGDALEPAGSPWWGVLVTFVVGGALSAIAWTHALKPPAHICLVLVAAAFLTVAAALMPTLDMHRRANRFSRRQAAKPKPETEKDAPVQAKPEE